MTGAEQPAQGRRLRRMLVVSRQFPLDFDRATHGIFQRLQNLMRAATDCADAVDALFFVPANCIGQVDTAHYEQLFRDRWGIDLALRLAPFSNLEPSWANAYLRPIGNIRYNHDFADTASIEQARAVRAALRDDTDVVLAHRLHGALPVHLAGTIGPLPGCVVDLDDVEHLKFFRELMRPPFWPGKTLQFLQVPAIAWAERRIAARAASLFVCSERDRRYLRRVLGIRNAEVVPNAVEVASMIERPLPAQRNCKILFLGTYSHRPNVEAAEFLVREVFPIVRQQMPNAELELVGQRVEVLSTFSESHPGVSYLGFVADLEPVFDGAGVMCCPILAGSGTRIKIIEAAARGLPVVSTTVGAEGLDFENGAEILIRDDAASLAQACLNLLASPQESTRLARAARAKTQRYDRRAVIDAVADSFRRAALRA